MTGAELVRQARGKNRLLALGVVAFMLAMFVMVFVVTKVNRLNATADRPAAQATVTKPATTR